MTLPEAADCGLIGLVSSYQNRASSHLFHLTGSVVVSRHAAALLSDLHGSGLQETISDRPLGHVASAIAPDLYLHTKSTNQPHVVQRCERLMLDEGNLIPYIHE